MSIKNNGQDNGDKKNTISLNFLSLLLAGTMSLKNNVQDSAAFATDNPLTWCLVYIM